MKSPKPRCDRRKNHRWIVKSHKILKYYVVYMPEHPHCHSKGDILEHRIVMEKKLGRYLKSNERVHHIDGNGLNNSPKNLILFKNPKEHNSYPHIQYQGWFPKGHIPWNKTFTKKKCLACGKKFELSPRRSEKRQTCSIECRKKYGWRK